MVLVQQARERAHAQPEQNKLLHFTCQVGTFGLVLTKIDVLPVGGFSFQRPVAEAAVAVTQVKVVVMVTVAGPTQSVTPSPQVHFHDLTVIDQMHQYSVHVCQLN